MKKLLRGITWQDPTEKTQATENLQVTQPDRILSLPAPEQQVLGYCFDFLINNGEAPALRLVYDYFENVNKPDVVTLLEEVLSEPFYVGGSFKNHMETVIEGQAAEELSKVLKEAAKIATVGVSEKGVVTKGVDAAVAHIFSSAKETPKDNKDRIPNSQKEATKQLKDLYTERKLNPHQTYGIMTGYGMIDSSTGGIRKKQLYLHAGFGGHLKSTIMLNQVVNAAVDGGWNPLVFSSEMPQDAIMYSLTAIHSANPMFATTHPPLNVFRLILGQMSQDEEDFYDLVHDNLVNDSAHGLIRVVDAAEFTTFGSIMQRTIREHSSIEVDELWVDYLTRLPVDHKYRGMSLNEARNETIADAKRFSMSFDNGTGLAVCSPFQVNREGLKSAIANEGKMNSTALAQYNAAEKEADVITYSFFGEDEKVASEPKVGMIKSRWGGTSETPVSMFLEPDSRRIFDMTGGMSVTDAPVGAADASAEVEI